MLRLFPQLREDPERLQRLVEDHYLMLARDTLDCFVMPGFTGENTRELLRVSGVEHLLEAGKAGRGVIMIISHFGRFFMLGPGLKLAGVEFGMLTTMPDERHPYYDAVDRWYISTKLRNTQLFSRGTWVTTVDDPRRIYKTLRSGEIMLIALDGNETTSRKRYEFPFLNGTLSLPEGIVRIAEKTGAKLAYAAAIDGGRAVDIVVHPLPDEPVAALGAAVRLLERDLLVHPSQWWQWGGVDALWRPGGISSTEEP